MEGRGGKTRYSSLYFLHDIILCFINLAFPEYFKRIFLYLLHSNEDQRSTLVYPSLQTENIPSSHKADFVQDPLSDPYDVQGLFSEPNETKAGLISPPLNIVPSKTLDRYKPLKLPSILHDFPPKHYKYLPMFDGENLTAEGHIQAFEHFADFFEIEHDDVSMRDFSQSLQGDAKAWFRHL